MGYFSNISNNRNVNFENLNEAVNEEGERIYSDDLIQELEVGNYNYINESVNITDRDDKNFMEPLLYAVKNSPQHGTYAIYGYYGENLQQDLGLLIEVVIENPEIIKGTPISSNRDFMLDVAEVNPKVIFYMSRTLTSDPEFIEELLELNDKGVDTCIKLIENPELANNAEFIKEAIKEEPSLLKNVSENLKNDYNFMKDITSENYEVVEEVIKNRESFGLEGIKGAKETTKQVTIEDYLEIINEMSEDSDDDRYKRVRKKIDEKGKDDPRTIKWITAMAAQNAENISPERFKKVFDDAILGMTKVQKDLTEDGKIKVSKENASMLITPQILNKLREAAITKGLELTPEQETMLKEYEEFHKEFHTELKKEKQKTYELKDIEIASKDAKLNEVKREANITRESIEAEKKEEIQTEEKEIGDE